MHDRMVHDLVIAALADAPFRSSAEWLDKGLADPEKVEKFARFLARHFYHERISHFFKYSAALAQFTGRRPEAVLSTAGFDRLMARMVLGSRESAARVGALVADHVRTRQALESVPYLEDLLAYEEAMMIAEAGPRVWREPAPGPRTGEAGAARRVVEKAESTALLELDHDITAVLGAILAGPSSVPEAPRTKVRLLVARSPHGKVVVAHSSAAMEKLLALADGTRTAEALLADPAFDPAELKDTFEGLAEWGALKVSLGS